MDDLEASYDDANIGGDSANMDDTGTRSSMDIYHSAMLKDCAGFFSVQVLEKALNVWGLE